MLYWEKNILAYGRFQGEEQIVVVLNNSKELRELTIPVWRAEVPENCRMERLMYSYEEGYTTMPDEYIVEHGEAVAVSYTHLDVYKRQAWRGSGKAAVRSPGTIL